MVTFVQFSFDGVACWVLKAVEGLVFDFYLDLLFCMNQVGICSHRALQTSYVKGGEILGEITVSGSPIFEMIWSWVHFFPPIINFIIYIPKTVI